MEKDSKREMWKGRVRLGSEMSIFPPIAEAQWICGGQDSHHGAIDKLSHTAQDHANNLNNAEFGPVLPFKLSISCARSHVCLIQQEGSALEGILMRFPNLAFS